MNEEPDINRQIANLIDEEPDTDRQVANLIDENANFNRLVAHLLKEIQIEECILMQMRNQAIGVMERLYYQENDERYKQLAYKKEKEWNYQCIGPFTG